MLTGPKLPNVDNSKSPNANSTLSMKETKIHLHPPHTPLWVVSHTPAHGIFMMMQQTTLFYPSVDQISELLSNCQGHTGRKF